MSKADILGGFLIFFAFTAFYVGITYGEWAIGILFATALMSGAIYLMKPTKS
jgi:hypothetical protein